ncbi:hypothetical protein FQN54_006461 [Arachnomyces sp. PD_36]|nr:hypothetical protein FQN54_006461 [Arachnomyces sp. PD_36]
MPENDPPLPYKDYGLYILMSNISRPAQWHWGIYICVSKPYGQVYHATNTSGLWEFQESLTDGVANSRQIIAAVELGMLSGEDKIDLAHKALMEVPVSRGGDYCEKWGEHFTCRIWVKEALEKLKAVGVVNFSSVDQVEEEAIRIAGGATRVGRRVLTQSMCCST